MGYKCSFLDNQAYAAQDVNDIFARITSGGVLFSDTGDIMQDLNEAQSQVVTQGVIKDTNACRVVLEDGVYKISKGACMMHDGTAIIFDSEGYELQVIDETKCYVYLNRNSEANTIDVIVSTYPGDEQSVPLAEIDAKGKIYDRRIYAKAKVDVGSNGSLRNFTTRFIKCVPSGSETVTISFEDGDFSYIIVWDGLMQYGESSQKRVANERNLIPLVDGESVSVAIGKYTGDHSETMYCEKDGQNLHIRLGLTTPFAEYTMNLGVI